ncbi:MAG: hypothetical protein D3916_09120 [Candidatus Electrothrix sp. MAN1_4]|nr:hypothetical protein [Candidatus Electrothrix sp. MAN1_4]
MIVSKNIVKDLSRIVFWFPVRWFILILPFSWINKLGALVGDLDYLAFGAGRIRKMCLNISSALQCKPEQAKRITRENLRNHSRNNLELLKYPQLNKKGLKKLAGYKNINFLDQALDRGKGVILLTAHFGAKQFLQVALGHAGYSINQINYHMDESELSFIQKNVSQRHRILIEEKIPITFIPAKSFMRSVFKVLKENKVLIIAGDGIGLKRHMDDSYIPFSFLGKKMLFPTNAVNLANRTGSMIIPVFTVREKKGHTIVFQAPINSDRDLQQAEIVQKYVSVLEKFVSNYPELWEFWEEFDEENLILSE